jgi:DNA-binding response OmpR family regulator
MARVGTVSTTTLITAPAPARLCARRGAILIVEDRADVRQGLAQLLEFQGYVVFEAADFDQACAQLESSPQGIALILLDLNLPGPGGDQIRATQLANPALADIPAIVVSASGPDLPGSASLQAAAWIEKPFRFDQLLEEIRRFVLPEGSAEFKTSNPIQRPDA